MNDHTELKQLAEACGDLNWRAIQENWCEWAIRDDHAYIATMRTKSAKHAGPCPEREAKAKFLCAVTPAAIKTLIAENDALRQALQAITDQVEGNIRPTVRDCVNGQNNVQDIYGYCDQIESIVAAAMKEPQP